MKNKIIITLAILLLPLVIFAQSKTVTGVVNDDEGLPLPQTIISFLLSLKIRNEVLVKREIQKRLKL